MSNCHLRVSTVIHHESISRFGHSFGGGDFLSQQDQLVYYAAVIMSNLGRHGDVFFWHDKEVNWSLRGNVIKGKCSVILSDAGRRDFAGHNFAEEAFTHQSLHC